MNLGRNSRVPYAIHEDCGVRPGQHLFDPKELTVRLKETIDIVKANLARVSVIQAKHYNLRRGDWKPAVGEVVYKKLFYQSNAANNFSSKLAPNYGGPYVVHNYLSPTVLELKEHGKNSRKIIKVHIKDLKEIKTKS